LAELIEDHSPEDLATTESPSQNRQHQRSGSTLGRHAARQFRSRRRIVLAAALAAVAVGGVAAAAGRSLDHGTGSHATTQAAVSKHVNAGAYDRSLADTERANRSENRLPSPPPSPTQAPAPPPTTAPAAPAPAPTTKKPAAAAPVTGGTECEASYYDEPQTTASGEQFDPNALTAAHKTLPLGTRIKVTNVDNGKTVVVRINDRGPYVAGRCLDLSRAAFEDIASLGAGTAEVRYQVL
jgi:rare lipoprotein A